MTSRLKAANHEAGHIIMVLHLAECTRSIGKRFEYAYIADVGAKGGAVVGYAPCSGEHNILVATAGLAGERVARMRPGTFNFYQGRWGDWIAAQSECEEAGMFDESSHWYIDRSYRLAWGIIKQYKQIHSKIVAILLKHGRIDYATALAIWEKARKTSRLRSHRVRRGKRV